MNVADLVLIVIGCYFVIRGLFRGITGEVFSLLSVVGGFYCALRFYAPISAYFSDRLGVARLVTTSVCMFSIFFLVFAGCAAADKAIKKLLNGANLSWADKAGGGIAGFVKLYVISLLVLVAGMIISPVTGDAWVRDSKTLILTARTWPAVYPVLDGIGVLPDLAELQREAKEYVIRQAAGSLFGPDTDFGALLPASGDITSGDITSGDLDSLSSADRAILPDASALTSILLPFLSADAQERLLPSELSRNKMLDFFLGWGGNKNK
ncbi:MAG: CvpA family protein [Synergistaceae bacterium]|jgi:uncharacterized membrane protein required for colicin V production|nr:CvpA family protein [Synergistaceae bacterium]